MACARVNFNCLMCNRRAVSEATERTDQRPVYISLERALPLQSSGHAVHSEVGNNK
jgi:hypothetical protein